MGPAGSFTQGGSSSARFAGHRVMIAAGRGHRPFNPAYGSYGVPYFYSDYYDPNEMGYQTALPEPPPPELQHAPQVKTEPVPDPLLLELHGSHWVRVTNFEESSNQAVATESPAVQPAPAKALPPATLVYRDGHTEEVSSYSIIGGSIYTKANYWTTGAWTRSIAIADLDIPATLKRNEERGVNFELPSGPDVVMLRP